jgi:Protein of unknown function (DUF2462)
VEATTAIIMAQGQPKMKKTAATAAKQNKKTKVTAVSRRQNKTTAKKGPRAFAPTKQAAAAAAQGPRAVTKAIDRKNEASIAAKAVSIGTQFFLTDIAGRGKQQLSKQIAERNKKQKKTNQLQRHVESLQKL